MMSYDNNSMCGVRMESGCNIPCTDHSPHMCIGYAYVMPQKLTEIYDPGKALFCGTLFPQLDIPLGIYERVGKCNHE